MFRKRRIPAPFFGIPGAPFNPMTGERAPLAPEPVRGTTLALFQVIEEDTHDNYVVCRGHEADSDPTFTYLHDPSTVPTTTPINVAKPYVVRGTNPYVVGQIVVAARIKGKLGYNPGKAETTVGHPADLDEVVELLLDDDDVGIAWLDIGASGPIVAGYRNPINQTITDGSNSEIEWTDYNAASHPYFTMDASKKKLYLPPGLYLSWLTLGPQVAGNTRITVTVISDGSAVTQQNTTIVDMISTKLEQVHHMGFEFVDSDGTYLVAKLQTVGANATLQSIGAWTVMRTG
jgi:hypothetical protein